MLSGLEIRALTELSATIHYEMAEYVTRLDSIVGWDSFVGERERFRTFQEVLDMIEAITKRLSE